MLLKSHDDQLKINKKLIYFCLDQPHLLSTVPYTRGGQLFWLEGHFEKAMFSGGPHLLF